MVFSFDTPRHAKPNTTKQLEQLKGLSRLLRYDILTATTRAGSRHPTSSLSAVDLMTGLMFGGAFRYDVKHPDAPNNDRAYSIKPLDVTTIVHCARETGLVITVEDHYAAGGLGEAVASALSASDVSVHSLAVERRPKSGKPDELLEFAGIAEANIIDKVKELTHDPG